MGSVRELIDVFKQLNSSNQFDVLVYARMKLAFQMAIPEPYVRERRKHPRVKLMRVHWVGFRA